MKVTFFVVNITHLGGIERTVINLCNFMVANYKYEIEIVSVFASGKFKKIFYELDPRIKMEFLDSKMIISSNILKKIFTEKEYDKCILNYLRANKCDIAIGTNDLVNVALSRIKNSVGCRVIGWEHADYMHYTLLRNISNVIEYTKLDGVVVLTQKDSLFYRRFLKNVRVIPNAYINTQNFSDNSNAKNIIALGRLTRVKGFDLLIESFNKISRDYKEWKLNIVGSGEERDNLVNQIKQLKIDNQVRILPATDDVEKYYCNSSIYALPSRNESFGMVLLEAMGHGLPCIAFESFGPNEIINNGEDGILVKNGDINKYASEIKKLMDNQKLRSRIGKKAQQNVIRFEISNVASLWKQLFEKLLS